MADDSAAELLAAAKSDRPQRIPHRHRHRLGRGPRRGLRQPPAPYAEVWKIANDSLAYPNAELVRQALVKVLPAGQHRAGSPTITSESIWRRAFPSR